MSTVVIVPLFAIGSYIALFGTIIGLNKRYKDPHYEQQKIIESEPIAIQIKKIPTQTKITEVPVEESKTKVPVEESKTKVPVEESKTKVPVEELKTKVPQTKITEVSEAKTKVTQTKITEVPVEESKTKVQQTKIKVPNSTPIVIQNKKLQTEITSPINSKIVEKQITTSIVPEVKTLQAVLEVQEKSKVERITAKESSQTKIQQNQKEKKSSSNESFSEVVAVAATAAKKTMQNQSQVTEIPLQKPQQQVQTPLPVQTPALAPIQTPQFQTPTKAPTPVQPRPQAQVQLQVPLQAQAPKQVQQNVQLDNVNKDLQQTISNTPILNVTKQLDNSAPSPEVVKQVIEFLTKQNLQHSNTTIKGGTISDDLNILILNYIEFLQYLLNTPNILRLSSLNADELQNAITGTDRIELTITNNSKTTTIDSAILLKFFNKFFYIDLNNLIGRLNTKTEQNLKVLASIVKKYIKNNENVISVYVFIQILKDIVNSEETAIKTYVYNIFSRYIVDMYIKKILDTYIEITEALNSQGNNNVTQALDKIFKDKAKNTILTFVKIRSDLLDVYNKRFDIKTDNSTKTKLYIKYNDHDFKYYVKDGDTFNISKETEDKKELFKNKNTINTLDPKKYEHQFLFGPFTNVFPPEYKNKKIAEQLPQIMESLKDKKPVIILGYGASGAGKTSTLVYLNKTNENGILIELCDKLALETEYKNIELTSYEFYRKPNKTKTICKKSPPEQLKTITFNYSNHESNAVETFLLSEEYTHTNTFTDRTKDNETTTIFKKDTKMGEVIIHLIDTDRYVKATTNNPNSSRSHALIIIKFKKSGEEHTKDDPVLIIGDFAGVENKFNCEDKDILSAFSGVRIDNDPTKATFYSESPIGIPEKTEDGQKGGIIKKPVSKSPEKSEAKPAATRPPASIKSIAAKPAVAKSKASSSTAKQSPKPPSPYLPQQKEIQNEDTCEKYNKIPKSIYIPSESSLRVNPMDIIKYTQFGLIQQAEGELFTKTELYNKIELMFMKLLNPFSINPDSNNFIKFITGNIDLPKLLEEKKKILERDLDILREYNNYIQKDFIIYLLSKFIDKDGIKIYRNVFQLDDKPCLNIDLKNAQQQKDKYPYFTCERSNNKDKINIENFAIASLYDNTQKYLENYINEVSKIAENISGNLKFPLKQLTIDVKSIKIEDIVKCHDKSTEKEKAIIKAYAHKTNTKCNKKEYEDLVSTDLNITPEKILVNIYNYFSNNFILKDIIDITLESIKDKNYSEVMTNLLSKLAKLGNLGEYTDVILEMYINFKELVLELSCRMKQAKEICEVRTNEGIMINDTLGECRNLIGKLIDEKNKDVINLIPSFENACLPTYCKDDVCFPKKQYTKTEGKGDIFSVIEKELTYKDKDKNKTNRYNDLIICIFCVFNISLTANNPPPVPYININELKLQFKNHQDITNICKNIINKITVDLQSKTGELMKDKKYKEFEGLFTKDSSQNGLPKGSETIINNFINLIDKFNAASAIGTLEFTDSLAKYYTTDIVCKPPDNLSGYIDILSKKPTQSKSL